MEKLAQTKIDKLPINQQQFLQDKHLEYKFSLQEIRQIVDFAIDFNMWKENSIDMIWEDKDHKKEMFKAIRNIWQGLKTKANTYDNFSKKDYKLDEKITFEVKTKDYVGLGSCPVASPNTRCCNLLTLDAVESCGFDCSYCSIQSFYNQNKISFDTNLIENLKNIKLDPNETYHIGTGQSSDSLMWGNREGLLDALFEFAKENPNVILEFKTKSNSIKYFLENEVPKNIIVSWSLNTPTIIENEEHLTATLDQRIKAARDLADKGILVGFHFHPIVHYENYLEEYGQVYTKLIDTFNSSEVVFVSLGTLTFIKPVIKKLRDRGLKSKILQMPFEDANGKASYPLDIKREMFKHAYDSFDVWHRDVYFYLCMEDHSLWKDVFGYEYISNNQMEGFMKMSYKNKIDELINDTN